jgi:dipeptidyl aminopeptidase/acylaminoacyl peptidase
MGRRITESDIANIQFVSDPQISPDGSKVAWIVTEMLVDEKRYRSRLWLRDVDGKSEPVQLTSGSGKDTSPRWAPDGSTLAFLSDRSGKNQIHHIRLEAGEAEQITDLADGVMEFDWSSSGNGFLFVARANQEHRLIHEADNEKPDEDNDPADDPRRITTLAHRMDGVGYRDGRRTHVGIALKSGRIVQLTSGDYDHTQPALSPCRRYLAFASNRSDERDNERRTDIWLMDLDSDTIRRITSHDGVYGLPVFSPDSSKLAFVGHKVEVPYGPTNLDRIWVANLESGHMDVLTESIDREMSNTCTGDSSYGVPAQRPVWTQNGTAIFSLISDRGNVGITRVSPTGAWELVVSGDREVMNFSLGDSGQITFTASDPTHPAEVFLCGKNTGDERQLSNHNCDLLSALTLAEPLHVPYQTLDGTTLDAWLLEPIDRLDGVKYPMVLEIHGGPHAMYGNTFVHEFQLMAGQGYAVLYTNPRGSTGYGQEFVSAAMGDWGGTDYQDVMAGLDNALQKFEWIDPNRLGVTGGSYGGYLVNWIVTQTDRFAAAITQRSTCNRKSLFGSSDLVWTYAEWEFRSLPWDDPDFYYDRSPLSHVRNVTTPVLIMHSENDLRCPIEQGEQWFTALKRLDRETEFVRFPGESHNLSRSGRPDRRLERLRWMTNWFGRHL